MVDRNGLVLSVFLPSSKQPCYDQSSQVADINTNTRCIAISATHPQIPTADATRLADRISSQSGTNLFVVERGNNFIFDVDGSRGCLTNDMGEVPKGAIVFNGQTFSNSIASIVEGCCRPGEFGDNW